MRIRAFRALRPAPENVSKVACPPYDVVDTAEAAEIARGNPLCFFHISRPEIDLRPGVDLCSDDVYAKAADNFSRFQRKGYLTRDNELSVYVYRLIMGDHQQTGIVSVCHIDDYNRGIIKKHEKTRKAPEEDRTRHTAALNANAGPVFLAYRDNIGIDHLVSRLQQTPPLFDFVAPDGVRHTLWKVSRATEVVNLFAAVNCAYIADGHHRAAAAARVAELRRKANPDHRGDEEYNWFMAVLFPAGQLKIMPYNRCVRDLNGMDSDAFLKKIEGIFTVVAGAQPSPKAPTNISMYLAGRWYGLGWKNDPAADPVALLDVSVLQDRLLSPILGIEDPRNNPRIEFVGGIRGTDELVKRVDSKRSAVAFSMYPTTVDQLMAIADAGQVMPPKSTWFEPKLKSGLLVHTL